MPETRYPSNLKPDPEAKFFIHLSDLQIPVHRTSPRFDKPTSHGLGDRFGGKPVVKYDGTAYFAEVAILRVLTYFTHLPYSGGVGSLSVGASRTCPMNSAFSRACRCTSIRNGEDSPSVSFSLRRTSFAKL